MSIRFKLALVLTAGITAAIVAAGGVFVSLQYSSVRAAQHEKRRLLVQSVSRLESESLLAHDPLMLVDYLQALRREHKEVVLCRVFGQGRWENVGDQADPGSAIVATALPDQEGSAASGLRVEMGFSSAVEGEQEQKALGSLMRDVSRTGTVVVLLGLLFSLPLSWTLTRRIVQIQSALTEIGAGKLGLRMPPLGSDEIGRLADGVNLMSERLQELDKLKKTFVASVTHELRSPLGAIEAYVKEMLNSPERFNPEDRASLDRIRNNTRRLGHFVTNLLDMAKIERGKLDYSPRSCDIGELVEDAVLFFSRSAADSGLALTHFIESDLPQAYADPDLITHVLTNLISNAVKFTRRGGKVDVTLRRAGQALECAVNDTGVGITKADMARVFTPFQRVANPLRATGVGLGLAISRSIIEMHGGTVGVQSEAGRGSRFFFVLPIGAHAATPRRTTQTPAAS